MVCLGLEGPLPDNMCPHYARACVYGLCAPEGQEGPRVDTLPQAHTLVCDGGREREGGRRGGVAVEEECVCVRVCVRAVCACVESCV
jgi:hypothetical protein